MKNEHRRTPMATGFDRMKLRQEQSAPLTVCLPDQPQFGFGKLTGRKG